MSKRVSVKYEPVDPQSFDWDRWLDSEGEEVTYVIDTPEPHRQVVVRTVQYGRRTVVKRYTIITNNPTFGPYRTPNHHNA